VDKVIEVAEQRDLEPTLLLAIIAVESRFNPKASNKSGAKGLMQVMMPLHADKFDTPKMVYTIDSNVEVGAKIWHDCMQRSRNLNAAAKCYSGGSTSWLAKVKRVKKDLDNI
jgi:soluble lytic murein transglycosylase-like protein